MTQRLDTRHVLPDGLQLEFVQNLHYLIHIALFIYSSFPELYCAFLFPQLRGLKAQNGSCEETT